MTNRPALRTFRALTGEFWAIAPDHLQALAAIALRQHAAASNTDAARTWQKRDYDLMAGPGAQRLPGAVRAYVVNGVAVLPITGPIFPRANMLTEMSGATSLAVLAADFQTALASNDVRAIQLIVDSPGGAVSGIASFAVDVARGANRKPVHAHVTGDAASAAYWIASAASRISVDRTSVVGSIGVVAARPKQVEPDGNGEVWIEIVSTNAPNKRPDPQAEDGLAEIRRSLDAIERVFTADVSRGRRVALSKVLADFGRGGVLIGAAARDAGMVDAVESRDAAMNALRLAMAGQSRARPSAGATTADERNRHRLAALAPSVRNQALANRLRLAELRRGR